jgi:hypothetical protein
MLNYLSSPYYKKWKKRRRLKFWYFFTLASILHIFLLMLGFKTLMSFLLFFLKNKKNSYYLENIAEVRKVKILVDPIFRRIRNSKYTFSNCFSSSIVLWFFLKKQGLASSIIIGTKKEKGKFKAHAWVEINKFPINENLSVKSTFSTFDYDFSNK